VTPLRRVRRPRCFDSVLALLTTGNVAGLERPPAAREHCQIMDSAAMPVTISGALFELERTIVADPAADIRVYQPRDPTMASCRLPIRNRGAPGCPPRPLAEPRTFLRREHSGSISEDSRPVSASARSRPSARKSKTISLEKLMKSRPGRLNLSGCAKEPQKLDRQVAKRILVFLHGRLPVRDRAAIGQALRGSAGPVWNIARRLAHHRQHRRPQHRILVVRIANRREVYR